MRVRVGLQNGLRQLVALGKVVVVVVEFGHDRLGIHTASEATRHKRPRACPVSSPTLPLVCAPHARMAPLNVLCGTQPVPSRSSSSLYFDPIPTLTYTARAATLARLAGSMQLGNASTSSREGRQTHAERGCKHKSKLGAPEACADAWTLVATCHSTVRACGRGSQARASRATLLKRMSSGCPGATSQRQAQEAAATEQRTRATALNNAAALQRHARAAPVAATGRQRSPCCSNRSPEKPLNRRKAQSSPGWHTTRGVCGGEHKERRTQNLLANKLRARAMASLEEDDGEDADEAAASCLASLAAALSSILSSCSSARPQASREHNHNHNHNQQSCRAHPRATARGPSAPSVPRMLGHAHHPDVQALWESAAHSKARTRMRLHRTRPFKARARKAPSGTHQLTQQHALHAQQHAQQHAPQHAQQHGAAGAARGGLPARERGERGWAMDRSYLCSRARYMPLSHTSLSRNRSDARRVRCSPADNM